MAEWYESLIGPAIQGILGGAVTYLGQDNQEREAEKNRETDEKLLVLRNQLEMEAKAREIEMLRAAGAYSKQPNISPVIQAGLGKTQQMGENASVTAQLLANLGSRLYAGAGGRR